MQICADRPTSAAQYSPSICRASASTASRASPSEGFAAGIEVGVNGEDAGDCTPTPAATSFGGSLRHASIACRSGRDWLQNHRTIAWLSRAADAGSTGLPSECGRLTLAILATSLFAPCKSAVLISPIASCSLIPCWLFALCCVAGAARVESDGWMVGGNGVAGEAAATASSVRCNKEARAVLIFTQACFWGSESLGSKFPVFLEALEPVHKHSVVTVTMCSYSAEVCTGHTSQRTSAHTRPETPTSHNNAEAPTRRGSRADAAESDP